MQTLDRVGALRDLLKRIVEVRQALELHRDMKLTEMLSAESELPSRHTKALKLPLRFQVIEIGTDIPRELGVADAVLKIAPEMVDVDGPILRAV